jgi:hypothetical protein
MQTLLAQPQTPISHVAYLRLQVLRYTSPAGVEHFGAVRVPCFLKITPPENDLGVLVGSRDLSLQRGLLYQGPA